eukprot:1671286-Rhodomonas_salina.1
MCCGTESGSTILPSRHDSITTADTATDLLRVYHARYGRSGSVITLYLPAMALPGTLRSIGISSHSCSVLSNRTECLVRTSPFLPSCAGVRGSQARARLQ